MAEPEVQHVVHYHVGPVKSNGAAVLLELLPGLFLQTFGIGNIYAGNVVLGIALMLTYWVTLAVNVLLTFVLIGFVTWPVTWAIYCIVACIAANNAANRANARAGV